MPASVITVNGLRQYTVAESMMPPLMKWLENYSYGALKDAPDGRRPDRVFVEMINLMAKAHYGDDYKFMSCVVDFNPEGVPNKVDIVVERLRLVRGGPNGKHNELHGVSGQENDVP